MSDTQKHASKMKHELLDELDDVKAVMLAVKGSDQYMQPMSPNVDEDTGTVWFISGRDTDLYKSVGAGADATFTLVSDDEDFHAHVNGSIKAVENKQKLDEIWSVFAGAWFEEGREDPNVGLLQMTLTDAAVWASEDNTLKVGWEMARAALTDGYTPDIGTRAHVTF